MALQRQRDTKPELEIRKLLHARGFRYRVDFKIPGLRRKADIVFTRRRLAVFIDGCFWHSCPMHKTLPKANREWWRDKLAQNVERDRDTDRKLVDKGWTVIRIWEHEDPNVAIERVKEVLQSGGD